MADPREPSAYRPLSRRRRWLIVALAVATAVTVVMLLVDPPGGVQRPRAAGAPSLPAPADCAAGQSTGCVGGKAEVLVPSRAASR